jgi:ADP-heptose:LPS heptosyltransferase
MKSPKQIIVVDFGGVGDLVLAIPFLRRLKLVFSSSEVSVLCAERTGAILKEQPYFDKLFLYPITPKGLFRAGFALRKKQFDMAINLMPVTSYFAAIKMYLLFLLISAKKWVGRNTEGRGFFYHIKIPEPRMQMEDEVLYYGKILKAISEQDYNDQLEFHITRETKNRAKRLLKKERNYQRDPLILINPGSDWPAKRWFVERYAEVVKRLHDQFPHVEFGVIGTKEERKLATVIKAAVEECVFILSGKTTLEVLPAILEQASLVITNDSGPAHIARAVKTPVLILAGPGFPAFFSIQGRNVSRVLYHPVSCAPCLKVSCDRMDCWKAISVDEVVDAASQLLEKQP